MFVNENLQVSSAASSQPSYVGYDSDDFENEQLLPRYYDDEHGNSSKSKKQVAAAIPPLITGGNVVGAIIRAVAVLAGAGFMGLSAYMKSAQPEKASNAADSNKVSSTNEGERLAAVLDAHDVDVVGHVDDAHVDVVGHADDASVDGHAYDPSVDGAPVDGAPVDDGHVEVDYTTLKEHWKGEVNFHGYSFTFAPDVIKDDKEVALLAVSKEGNLLEFASLRLKDDKPVVLAALSAVSYGEKALLQFASSELRQDREVVLAALKQNKANIQFAAPHLLNLLEIAQAVITPDGEYLKYFSREMILSLLKSLDVSEYRTIPEEVQKEIDQFRKDNGCDKDRTKYGFYRSQAAGILLENTQKKNIQMSSSK